MQQQPAPPMPPSVVHLVAPNSVCASTPIASAHRHSCFPSPIAPSSPPNPAALPDYVIQLPNQVTECTDYVTGRFVYRKGQLVPTSLDLYLALEYCDQVGGCVAARKLSGSWPGSCWKHGEAAVKQLPNSQEAARKPPGSCPQNLLPCFGDLTGSPQSWPLPPPTTNSWLFPLAPAH